VGFVFATIGNRSHDQRLILVTDYDGVPDEHYIETHEAGARINSDAIRRTMQSILNTNSGAFHVHLHSHRGEPSFSGIDRRSIPKVVAAFRTAEPEQPHGMFLISEDCAIADIWMPGQTLPIKATKVTIVGHPIEFFLARDI
jgi:hypothetical protein